MNKGERATPASEEALSVRADAGVPDSRPTSRCEGSTLGAPAAGDPPAFPRVPGYEILGLIGRGGMGVVYKARHERLNRVVALKIIIKAHFSPESDAIKRFQREARSAAQLFHPNIVVLFDADEAGDVCFIAMEYVDGVDLHQLVKERGPLPIDQACDYIRQAALGLQHALESKLVHRDIKPSNLLVALPTTGVPGHGIVKILDLGLALPANSTDPHSAQFTQHGGLMGTPDYVAPEQAIDSHAVDIRADLYSLGFTFYYLLTGKAPFGDQPLLKKLMMHQMTDPRPVQELRPEVPPAVGAILQKLMKKQPAERYQTPAELVAALMALNPAPTRAPTVAAAPANDLGIPISPTLAALLRKPSSPGTTSKPPSKPPASPTPPRRSTTSESGFALRPVKPPTAEELDLPPGVERAQKIASLEEHRGSVPALAFSHDRSTLISGGIDGKIRRWDMSEANNRDLLFPQNPHRADIAAVAISPDDRLLASGSGSLDDVIVVWDLSGEAPAVRFTIPARHNAVEALAFDRASRLLAGGGTNNQVQVWEVGDRAPTVRFVLKGHEDSIKALAFAAEGDILASASQDGTVRTWSLGRGIFSKDAALLDGGWGPVRALAFSPRQPLLAFGGLDHKVRLCDIAAGGRKWTALEGHPGGIRAVAFNRDGKTLLSLCDSGHLILWNVATHARQHEWKLPSRIYNSFALTHDGRYLATGENSGAVSLFRLYPGSDK